MIGLAFALAASLQGWSYQKIADPITDAQRGIASLEGDSGRVVFKCDTNGPTSLYMDILPTRYLGIKSGVSRQALIRIDGGPVRPVELIYGERDAALTENGTAFGLARDMAAAQHITVRLTDFRGENVDVDLRSNGDPTAVKTAMATCGQQDYSDGQLAPALPHEVIKPLWAHQPDAGDFNAYYPDRAQRLGRDGSVTLRCTATASGSLASCTVLSETPPDYEFGSAALKLARLWRLQPRDGDGVSVEKGMVTIPLTFSMSPSPSPGR